MSLHGTSRHEARERALTILYEADIRRRGIARVLADHRDGDSPPSAFTTRLVEGVAAECDTLDVLIRAHAHGWTLERMPIIDRNVLRLATWELTHTDIPTAVAIDEAVTLAKSLSTDDSGRFVNGLLARIATAREAARE